MSFDPDAQLDTSQINDQRGRFGGRGGGGLAAGGGGLGIIGVLLYLFTGIGGGGGGGGLGALEDQTYGPRGGSGEGAGQLANECRTGADANRSRECRIVAYVNAIQDYWAAEYQRLGGRYRPANTTFFEGQTNTGCGGASSAVGPFYCPADSTVYIDLSFFDELESRFGASGGSLSQGYVIAHEYGHHIQNLENILDRVRGDRQGPESAAVRSELQADCFAGVFVGNADETILQPPTRQQIADALSAAAAVGDDRIQESTQGQVNPEVWTHGSSEWRQGWFLRGFEQADPDACDTFAGSVEPS